MQMMLTWFPMIENIIYGSRYRDTLTGDGQCQHRSKVRMMTDDALSGGATLDTASDDDNDTLSYVDFR